MRIYYSLGSSAPRTTARNPFDYTGRNRQASRRYTLGVLSAGAEGELEQYPGQIRFRCACCGDCPPDDCARTCDNCYCDTSQQKYIVCLSEPPTMLDGSDCPTCETFGVNGDGCSGADLCFTLIQNTASGGECEYISAEFQYCDITWRISYSVVADGPITLYNKDNPSQYAKWCYSADDVDPSDDPMTCPGYTVPIDCSDERKKPFGKVNAGILTRARWYKYEDSGAMPCNWMVGAYTGEPVIINIRPYKDPQTQCTPDTSTCNCYVCCDTPVRNIWVTFDGATKYGNNPTAFGAWNDWGDDGCPDAEGGSPGAGCLDLDCMDCSRLNGVYQARLERPTPGTDTCCNWLYTQAESEHPGAYSECPAANATIGFFLEICRDVRVCTSGSQDSSQCADNPTDSDYYTRIGIRFSETNNIDFCFTKYIDQSDINYEPGHDQNYCDDILENESVLNAPSCQFDGTVLDQFYGCLGVSLTDDFTDKCAYCDGPGASADESVTGSVCFGMTSATATLSYIDPGL